MSEAATGNDHGNDHSPLGSRWVGRNAAILLAVYLVVLAVALAWAIVQLWPPLDGTSTASVTTRLWFWTFSASPETHLVLLLIMAGALGTQAHVLRSFSWYLGSQKLKYSWLMRYFLMPFGGVALALAFYFVVRGGFLSAGASASDLSPFGFVAMAVIVGMFTEQAFEKLKKVASAFFDQAERGKDSASAESGPPK